MLNDVGSIFYALWFAKQSYLEFGWLPFSLSHDKFVSVQKCWMMLNLFVQGPSLAVAKLFFYVFKQTLKSQQKSPAVHRGDLKPQIT